MKIHYVVNYFMSVKAHFKHLKHDHTIKPKTISLKSLDNRRDLLVMKAIGKHSNPKGLILANLIHNPDSWPGDWLEQEGELIYKAHQKRLQSLTYVFKEDLKKLASPLDKNIEVTDGKLPVLIKEYIRSNVTLETVTILCDICQCYRYWNKRLTDDPIWSEHSLRILKYRPFLKYDKEKFRNIVVEHFRKA